MSPVHPRIKLIDGFLQDLCLNFGARPTGSEMYR